MLEVKNVSAGYRGEDVVSDLSFTLPENGKMCIIGPNGCGKTTLLRAVARLIPCSSGSITIDGRNIAGMKQRVLSSKMAMLGQLGGLQFSYSVWDTVMMGRYLHQGLLGRPSLRDKQVVESCLETVSLSERRDSQISELSGGQLQRVFLARVFAQEPNIILLDEPTNHLDLRQQVELTDHMKEWANRGNRAVIGVFHDLSLAFRFADTFLLMDKGRTVSLGAKLRAEELNRVYGLDVRREIGEGGDRIREMVV